MDCRSAGQKRLIERNQIEKDQTVRASITFVGLLALFFTSMKLFHRLPKSYQYASVAALTAFTMVSVGLFVNALLPSPAALPVASQQRVGSSPNAEAASGILITPANPNLQTSRSTAAPTAGVPAETIPKTPSPTSSDARVPSPSDIDAYTEPYDDLATTSSIPSQKFNHFAYAETDISRLDSVGLFIRESYEREEELDYEAADAFFEMKAAAAEEGVFLLPISGFRTIERQAELFAKQTEKLGSEAAAAELSAPPGHSEHHTGYAIDIGDVNSPDSDIKYSFENTPAYRWLIVNARSYGFEQSFPYDNQQGVSFEPWHWRYVASARASAIFSKSRAAF